MRHEIFTRICIYSTILMFSWYGVILYASEDDVILNNNKELNDRIDQLAEDIALKIPNNINYIAIADFFRDDKICKVDGKNVPTALGKYVPNRLAHYLVNAKIEHLLFSVETNYQSDLERHIISKELMEQFGSRNIKLPKIINISKKGDSEWLIIDNDKNMIEYIIKSENSKLNVYKPMMIMERSELEEVIKEYEIEMSDFFNPATVKRLGNFHGVDAILTGKHSNFEGYVDFRISLVNMASGVTMDSFIVDTIPTRLFPSSYIECPGGNDRPIWEVNGKPKDQTILSGECCKMQVHAVDPNMDTIAYSAIPIPVGATVDSKTGIFSWCPSKAQHGQHQINFTADDQRGGVINASATFTVNTPPKLKISDVTIEPDQEFNFYVSAQDEDGDSLVYGVKDPPKGSDFSGENGHFQWRPENPGKTDLAFYVTDEYKGRDEKTIRLIATEPLSIVKGKKLQWVSDGKLGLNVQRVTSGFYTNIDFQIRNLAQRPLTIKSFDIEVYDNRGGYQKSSVYVESGISIKPGETISDLQAPSVVNPSAFLLKAIISDCEYSGIFLVDISNGSGWNPTQWNYTSTLEIKQNTKFDFPDNRDPISRVRETISAKLGERIALIQAKAWSTQWDDEPQFIEAMPARFALYGDSEETASYLLVDSWIYTYRCREDHWLDVGVSHNYLTLARQYNEGHIGGLNIGIDRGKWGVDDFEVMEKLERLGAVFRGGLFRIAMWKIEGAPKLIWTVPFRVDGKDFIMDAQTGDILIPLEDPMDNPDTPFIKYSEGK